MSAFAVAALLGLELSSCTAKAPESARSPESPVSASLPSVETAEPEKPPHPPLRVANAGLCPRDSLIDDMEDGDAYLLSAGKRSGRWITYKDEEGSTIEPTPEQPFAMAAPGANGSKHAAHMKGQTANGVVWVGIGLNLTDDGAAYDASCCTGVSFWARKQGPRSATVRFKIGDAQTVPEGGICTDCYNDFGVDLGFTEEWTQYTLDFARMSQQPHWGQRFEQLRADAIFHLQWQVNHPRTEYDIWLDDVAFVGCGSASAGPSAPSP